MKHLKVFLTCLIAHTIAQNQTPYVITEARLREIRSQFMYWFNDTDWQNSIQSYNPQVNKDLYFQLPFFGFRFNYTRVSLNGYLDFSDPPDYYEYPLVFPEKRWPAENDPSFIGIFFSKCRIGKTRAEDYDQRRPGVYFAIERDLPARTDQMGVELRERLMWDVREGIVGADHFVPHHAVTVTWKNVSFARGIEPSLYVTNTFQLILATDETYTYAIFNYLDLQWTTHTEAGGDTLTGQGGVPAFVGFNAGNGTRSFEYKPYSQVHTIKNLTTEGFVNGFKGRHIFRVDEQILPGTCNEASGIVAGALTFAPESGNMLGGTVVNVTGPCFDPLARVVARFGNATVNCTVVNTNKAVCVQPQLSVEGYVRLELAVNGSYNWRGNYYVETPAAATENIFFADDSVHERNPTEIKIRWSPQNLTLNQDATVQISLWGYREKGIRPSFLFIGDLAEGVSNTGQYVIIPETYRNRDNRLLRDLQFGFIQINVTESGELRTKIWSRPIPLAWYFRPQWEQDFGDNWPQRLCENWLINDRLLTNFEDELPQCPCTLSQALMDKGRFITDFDCDMYANPRCFYNRGAVHCVRSAFPSLDGAEQQCCYDNNDFLMLSQDQQWGSSPRRSHNLGRAPWNESTQVPSLSQWYNDVVPRYTCCLWQDEQAEDCRVFRYERRPSKDCVGYQGPGVGGVYGDPHFVTFDGLEYLFNGKGEFVLTTTNTTTNTTNNLLEVQGRFEEYGGVNSTQLTAVVARGNMSSVVEVRVRPTDARWRYHLDVFADSRRVYFDSPQLKVQHFRGVTVYTPSYIHNQSQVIVMFDSGAGIEVVENGGFMSARVYLPPSFLNQTRGLLGNWSLDLTDDLTNPDGELIPGPVDRNDFERIHYDFGLKWMLQNSSLFLKEYGRNSSTYNNRTFKPEFRTRPEDIIPDNAIEIREAYRLCPFDNDYECKYDYALSFNKDLALFTSYNKEQIANYQWRSWKQVVSCGVLETPRFGRKSSFLFVPGVHVNFECDAGFGLFGDEERYCLQNGRWDTEGYGFTKCLRLNSSSVE